MSLISDLTTYLKTKSAVTDLVGTSTAARIFPNELKQNATLPAVVLSTFPGESYAHLKGRLRIGKTRIQIDCYDTTESDAATLDKAIDDILRPDATDTRTTWNARIIKGLEAEGTPRNGIDRPIQGGAKYRFWSSRDYMVTHAE